VDRATSKQEGFNQELARLTDRHVWACVDDVPARRPYAMSGDLG
jgi:hypothetical protein